LLPKALLPSFLSRGGILMLLKNKRKEFPVTYLTGSLHVEEKAREKYTHVRVYEGSSSARLGRSENFHSHKFKNKNNSRGKRKFDGKKKAT
jgi:hypothetical protein